LGKAQSKDSKLFYDYARTFHFGFTIGTNLAGFKYEMSPAWYSKKIDTFNSVSFEKSPGITLGGVMNLHLGKSELMEHFDLRFIPSLVLSSRKAVFTVNDNSFKIDKPVESAIINLPLLLKFKSDRFGSIRFYTIAGLAYGYDLSSDSKSNNNKLSNSIAIGPSNFNYEYGLGLDIYFPFFKFSPEIKWSRGFNDLKVSDEGNYNGSFKSLKSQIAFISLYFEG